MIGYNMFGHIAIVSMAFFTWLVMKTMKKQYPDRVVLEQLRQPDRAQRDLEMSDEEKIIALQKIDSQLRTK